MHRSSQLKHQKTDWRHTTKGIDPAKLRHRAHFQGLELHYWLLF